MALRVMGLGSLCAIALASISCTDLESPGDRAGAKDSGNTGTEAGSAGEGGSSGIGGGAGAGMSGQSGGTGMSGSGGSGGTAGTMGSQDSGMDSSAAMDAEAGADDADIGGDADASDAEVDGALRGRVIDYNGNAVPGISVTLNGVSVLTGTQGEFAFDSAPGMYSISLSVAFTSGGSFVLAGYLFVDLTRRDPTLQVFHGLPRRGGWVVRNVSGATLPVPNDEKVLWQVASQYDSTDFDISSSGTRFTVYWHGPEVIEAHAHAIRILNSAPPRLPLSYLGHDEASFTLSTMADGVHALDLSASEPLPSDVVAGTITGTNGGARENHVYVRFEDDVAIQVVEHYGQNDEYSYPVPMIANSSIAVAATRGGLSALPYAVAYDDGVAPGATDVDLEIPVAATLSAPGTGATNVDQDTSFQWSGPDQVYMFAAKVLNASEYYYVITPHKEAKLPVLETSEPSFRHDTVYTWTVTTHGTFATMDEATGPEGYLDSYCYGRLRGPRRGPGSHTESTQRSFTTAP
jgi:hypothetical protein